MPILSRLTRLSGSAARRPSPAWLVASAMLAVLSSAPGLVAQPQHFSRDPQILISLEQRHLWLVVGRDTLFDAPVAIGMNAGFEYAGRSFFFSTPRGTLRVLGKEPNPVLTPPDWHYYGKAREQGLEVVHLTMDSRHELSDGTWIVVHEGEVGRVNTYGNFWPFTPGTEIIFDGRIFVPPFGTPQRRVPDALGPYKLDMGGGYIIHGTNPTTEDSIGQAVSHGCVRLSNRDIDRLYWLVEPGTVVHIF
jgi:hypothetical protein